MLGCIKLENMCGCGYVSIHLPHISSMSGLNAKSQLHNASRHWKSTLQQHTAVWHQKKLCIYRLGSNTAQSASLAVQLGVQLAEPAVAWPAPAQRLAWLLGAHAPGFVCLTRAPYAA